MVLQRLVYVIAENTFLGLQFIWKELEKLGLRQNKYKIWIRYGLYPVSGFEVFLQGISFH